MGRSRLIRKGKLMHVHFKDPGEILQQLMERYPVLIPQRESIEAAYCILRDSFEEGGKLLVCGNGGSAADALHIASELMKAFILRRKTDSLFETALLNQFPEDANYLLEKLEGALPVIPLVENVSVSTAIQNDTAADMVFAQQVYALGKENDVFLGISTSGNSQNIVYAAEVASARGMRVITLTGKAPNRLEHLSDCQIAVNEEETFRVQELHLPIYHTLCLMLENWFFADRD